MTSFANKVLEAVRKIPRGKTVSYKEVARRADRPKAWRAVGNILNKNRDPKIPCHRVIRSDGKIGEYNRGKKIKESLLKEEGAIKIKTARVFYGPFLFKKSPFIDFVY